MRALRWLSISGFALALAAFACAEEVDPPIVAAGGAGGASAAGGGGAGGLVGFLGACTQNEQCETGLCHTFPSKGQLCSKPCDDAAACEAPSPGCNGMGVCRAP